MTMAIPFKTIQARIFLGALIGITLLFIWMIQAYIYPVFWAAVMAALFHPLYKRINKLFKHDNAAAGLTELIIVLIVVIPLAGLVWLVVQQAIGVYQTFGNKDTFVSINTYLQNLLNTPFIVERFGSINITEQLTSVGADLSKYIYSFITTAGQNTARVLIQLFIMLYTLFFFLKDGSHFLKTIMHLLPLGDTYEERLYDRFVSTTRATLKGTIVIGVIQGTAGCITLLLAGVPGALFWGVIMIVCSIIPGVGTSLVLIPTLITLVIMGQWWPAVIVLIGWLFATTIDNFIRGPMVGKDAQMHPLFILFATLGGLLSFGLSGVVIGPVITALLLSIWQIYEEKYHDDLVKMG
ncbi:MAG: AI-2E family transporter [Patescibacteria group bacterium]|jgi:predicted PurR-regulated permease PerM